MPRLIISHINLLNITNYDKTYYFNHKFIRYYLTKWYYEHKKLKCDGEKISYDVEELEDE